MKTNRPKLLDCGHPPAPHSSCTTGYGSDSSGKTYCYACCAELDKTHMRKHGKIMLYLTKDENSKAAYPNNYKITNWPGSLEFTCTGRTEGQHNIAGTRQDVWFIFENEIWHGVQYGQWSDICHCTRTKRRYPKHAN